MSPSEVRTLRWTATVLLLASVARWGWSRRSFSPPASGPEILAPLLDTTRLALDEARLRGRPLTEGERLDPNRATEPELDRLPGVGPAVAQALVRHREEVGGFRSPDELLDVRGIGPATLERIRPHLVLPGAGAIRAAAGRPKVDVNRADADELQTLPGIGPALAARILEARRGRPFRSVEDLRRVPGIGPATATRLRGLVVFGR